MDEVQDILSITTQNGKLFQVSNEVNSDQAKNDREPRVLYPLSESELDDLIKLIGNSAVKLLQAKVRNENMFSYTLGGGDRHYAALYNDKALVIDPFNDGTRTIALSFRSGATFRRMLDSEISVANTDISPQLEKGSLDFLKLSGDFLRTIDSETVVFISPNSKRRERVFRSFAEKYQLKNIVIFESQEDDLKGHK